MGRLSILREALRNTKPSEFLASTARATSSTLTVAKTALSDNMASVIIVFLLLGLAFSLMPSNN